MAKLVLFNKPYDVLCQFTDAEGRSTLANYIDDPALSKVYPAGRLDRDSEGLVILTDDGQVQHYIAHPNFNKFKTYWVQVEGEVTPRALEQLRDGVELKDGQTLPATAESISPPKLWERSKPVRYRANIPTSWLSLSIREGRNRQVRRMTAAVGFPTLRLVRVSVDVWSLSRAAEGAENSTPEALLAPGEFSVLDIDPSEFISIDRMSARPRKKPKTFSKTNRNKNRPAKPAKQKQRKNQTKNRFKPTR